MKFEPRTPHVTTVRLDEAVLNRCREFAFRQEEANRRNKRKNKQGFVPAPGESLSKREMGMAGDAALAICLGMSAVRVADQWRRAPDVGEWDVTTTDLPHGKLIVTPRDRLDMKKVLVVCECPDFHICGWYLAGEARKHSEWWQVWRKDGGAWYVPQECLWPLTRGGESLGDAAGNTLGASPPPEPGTADWRAVLRDAGVEK